MPLRFFTDHCVPNAVIHTFRAAGHEVWILKEHIPRNSDDPLVIAKAQELEAILVSLEWRFCRHCGVSTYGGMIALQVKDHPEMLPVLMQRLMIYLSTHPGMSDYKGQLFVVEAHRIRIRS